MTARAAGYCRRDDHATFAPLKIGSRALDLLTVLIERRGDVVSKDEIMAAVWPPLVVEEANLFFQISDTSRSPATDSNRGKSCIQTVVGRGYRLPLAPEQHDRRQRQAEIVEPTPAGRAARRRRHRPPAPVPSCSIADLGGDEPEQEYLAGRRDREPDYRPVADKRILRHRPQHSLGLLKGKAVNLQADRPRPQRALCARGQRAARRKLDARQRAAARSRDRQPHLGLSGSRSLVADLQDMQNEI